MKKCSKCKEEKEDYKFAKDKRAKTGLSSWCKTCISKVTRPNRKTEAIKSQSRKNYLKYKYGLTPDQLEEMYIQQEGKCAICGVFKSTCNRLGGLYIDHDHTTQQVRQLLCSSCNILLGAAKDSTEILQRSIGYINLHKKERLAFTPTNHN